MSVAGDVLKWAKQNVRHDGSGNEIYVDSQTHYPHMHITTAYVGYSTSPSHRRELVRGDDIYRNVVADVAQHAAGDAQQVATYINMTW